MIERNIELDKSIAYFMGWRIDNSYPDKDRVWRSPNGGIELDTTFKFSSDWNKLMEVYEAVHKMNKGYYVEIHVGSCLIYLGGRLHSEKRFENTQEAVYECLGEFIREYNKSQIKNNGA